MSKVFTLCSAAVLAATGAFAQMSNRGAQQQQQAPNPCACLEQGMGLPMEKKCFPAAYNAPASISVSCGWDFNVFGAFLYWYVGEEDLDVAFVSPTYTTATGTVAYQKNTWKPGFQVGVGFNTNYDDWVGWVEYTWMHQTATGSQTAPALISGAPGTWSNNDWFITGTNGGEDVVSGKWKMYLDMIDAFFSRPYYEGTQLTVSPFAGLRALWIRQRETVNFTSSTDSTFYDTARAQSNSWAIGPAAGVGGHWLLGWGFRFEGKATASLLYTQYTTVAWSQTNFNAGVVQKATASQRNLNTVRPMAQLGVGMGWGSYLDCQKYYVDFAARYDFNYLWDQNEMRVCTTRMQGFDDDVGALYLHGLTVTARFDF